MTGPREPPDGAEQRRSGRPDVSMSLLLRLMENPLDSDYARAAERRGRREDTPRRRRGVLFVALLCVGALTSVAVAQARDQPITNEQRTRLATEIEERTARTDELQQELATLRQQTAQLRAARLANTERGQRARGRLRELELSTGVVPVDGPGLMVTLADAPPSEDGIGSSGGAASRDRVLDQDLQLLVDALWRGGAEAIAVDGQRITSLTAIRSAGEAILVNYRPIEPPYQVTAIGDPDTLRSRLAGSEAGRRFHTLHANLGIRFRAEKRDEVRLPGASGVSLRYAQEVDDE